MSPPQTIAHYRIISKLGEGGMGAVYRASDTKLNREVAIKVLPDSFASDPDRLARFTREAQVLASLNHPNIAQIYGVEERALVMELVEGEELRGPLPVDTAVTCARQIAEALEAAHEKGIIHRDLKPANIKMTPQGSIKVLDFGLAAVTQPGNPVASRNPEASPTLTLMGATQNGLILGTAGYMSPEQASGKPVDKRADIWSFGVVLWEMLTGERLFEGETVSHTLAAVLTKEPDFECVPAQVRRLLKSCLEKDARKRLRDVADAWRLLDEDRPAATAPSVQQPQLAWRIAAIVASAVALATAGIAWRESRPELRPLLRLTAELGPDGLIGPNATPVLSPDGSFLLFEAKDGEARSLALLPLGQAKSVPVPGTAGARYPFFSPDGEWIGYFDGTSLKKVRIQGGASFTLRDAIPNPRGGDFFPDGSLVVSPGAASGLARIPAAGGPPEPLTDPPRKNQATHRWPQVLPGGRYVLFTANSSTNDFENAELDLLDVKTGTWWTIVQGSAYGRYLPSGHLVYLHNRVLFAARFDPGGGRPPGAPVPILNDVVGAPTNGHGRLSFSQSGLFSYFSGAAIESARQIVWMDRSRAPAVFPIPPAAFSNPRISPDGRLIAVDTAATGAALGVWDIARQILTPLHITSTNVTGAHFPLWTPDGQHLIFRGTTRQGKSGFWWVRADAGGEPVKLWETNLSVVPTSISPDGRHLLFTQSSPSSGLDIYRLPLDLSDPNAPKAGQPQPFLATPQAEFSAMFSPDGNWVAYTEGADILVRAFPGPGGVWEIPGSKGSSPAWAPIGRRLLFLSADGKVQSVEYETRGASFLPGKTETWGAATVARPMTVGAGPQFDMARDGRLVTVVAVDTPADHPAGVTILVNFFDELKRRLP